MSGTPVVLFACVHNSGRSVAARVLTEHYAAGGVQARSAGSEPKDVPSSGSRSARRTAAQPGTAFGIKHAGQAT